MSVPIDLPNARVVAEGVISAGQPSAEQLRGAAASGVKTVINLRAAGECGWDEETLVTQLRMRYVPIPVRGMEDVNVANAQRLHEALRDSDTPVVIHCGSGNRVGALLALRAFHFEGRNLENALECGRRAGLTLLEPHIRTCLATYHD